MNDILNLLLLALIVFVVIKISKNLKTLKVGSLALITGGVKCGKSTLSVYLAIREHKARKRSVKFANIFRKMLKKELIEEPLLYSNIPLNYPYSPLTKDLLLRKERFVYGSVIYVCEASLVADSQSFHNDEYNETLLLFNKLIGHETHGGMIIYDTQNYSDCHYSIKRSLSNYFYIHHLVKIPFFLLAYVREYVYSEDNNISNINEEDTEETLKAVLIPKSTWKKFDCYCYSSLTDNLPVSKKIINKSSTLKVDEVLSIKGECNAKKKS